MARKWTNAEIERIIEVVNDYPGCYIHAFRMLSPELNRSIHSIRLKFNKVKFDYDTPIVVSATGKKTPNGITRWNSHCVPDITLVRRWQNIRHLLFLFIMVTILVLYSIFTTCMLLYMYFEPNFELKLEKFDDYDLYTLYLHYIIKSDESGTKYKSIKLLKFKIKNNKDDKRRTTKPSSLL